MTVSGFFALAETNPRWDALVTASGVRYPGGDLLSGMNRIARGLRRLGLVPGDTLAVVLSNRHEFVEAYGAAIQSGLFFVAVNWHLGQSEVGYILQDSGARALITESQFAGVAQAAAAEASIDPQARFTVDGGDGLRPLLELIEAESAEAPADRSPGQIMFYTSGTTGRPKGVRKSFRGEASDLLTLTSGIGLVRRAASPPVPDLVYLSSGPFYHALPIAGAVGALDSGGQVVMMDKWSPELFLDLVERYHVTNATLVPTMFHRLLALPEDVRNQAEVSSLRAVNHAGAPCSIDVKRRMIDWWGPIITEGYSSTEGAGTSVTSEEWLRKPGTVGRPSPGVELKIFDDEGQECPPGVEGHVFMTPSLWDFEYLHDPDKTESARRGRMFTVGDIGYLDEDGYLFLCDREADTIISGGVNIYPSEIEAALLEHPAVRDVAVIGVPSEEWGEDVRAVVELHPGAEGGTVLAAELIEFCRARMAHYKCPRAVDFVASLDRDPNGKLRKRAVRAKYWPDQARRI